MSRCGGFTDKRMAGRWEAHFIHHYENGVVKYRYEYYRMANNQFLAVTTNVLDLVGGLAYNMTPAEEEKPLRWEFASLLSKAFDHMTWPRSLDFPWPHISVVCFRADHIVFFSARFLLAAATAVVMHRPIFRWPLVLFGGTSFDHIIDHSAERTAWKQ